MTGSADEHSRSYAGLSRLCQQRFEGLGLRIIGRVCEGKGTIDVAIQDQSSRLFVLRCVDQPKQGDYRALQTMVREGDFVRAGLVYTTAGQNSAEIPSWSVDDGEALLCSLSQWASDT